jgi:glutamate-1-semialdehyde aminotransferase
MNIDMDRLRRQLHDDYEKTFPVSAELNRRAGRVLVDGGSHAIRLIRPFPPRIPRTAGARITTEDGVTLLDIHGGKYNGLEL